MARRIAEHKHTKKAFKAVDYASEICISVALKMVSKSWYVTSTVKNTESGIMIFWMSMIL